MALAFYRKYRPGSFNQLVGQSAVQQTLLEALKQQRLVHAYLFSGPRGTGKTSTARLIARCIQCEKPQEDGQACGSCDVCQMSARGELVDLVEIDAASNRGIDEIRDLREKIRFAPTYAKAKVYIIDEVHMLTKEAFNALLKSLEEPPPHVYFILATTEVHKIPETILSRCQRYDFRRISRYDIVDRLSEIAEKENLDVEKSALELIAKHANGGLRDAITLLEQFSSEKMTEALVKDRLGISSHHAVEELYGALGSANTQSGLAVIEKLHNEGANLQEFTNAFLGHLRHKLHEAIDAKKDSIISKLLEWIDHFDQAWVKLKSASIAQLPLEIAVIRATHHVPAMHEAPLPIAVAANPEGNASNTPAHTSNSSEIQNSAPKTQEKRSEGLMHMDAINQNIKKIAASIKNPTVRYSFESGKVKNYDAKKVTMVYSSQFHFDNVHKADATVEIESAFQKIMGNDIKVVHELDDTSMTPENTPVDSLGWETIEEPLNN